MFLIYAFICNLNTESDGELLLKRNAVGMAEKTGAESGNH